jgi:ABC-type polar amino acid transport system ATPase subunit
MKRALLSPVANLVRVKPGGRRREAEILSAAALAPVPMTERMGTLTANLSGTQYLRVATPTARTTSPATALRNRILKMRVTGNSR